MAKCVEGGETEQMDIRVYTDIYFEFLKLFNHFGSAVKIGFKGKYC